jgi:HSP20 family molecular chaperone IbpA
VKGGVQRGVPNLEAERGEEKHDRQRTQFHDDALRRSVTVPAAADEEKISARNDNGILDVHVPLRKPMQEGREIPVERA